MEIYNDLQTCSIHIVHSTSEDAVQKGTVSIKKYNNLNKNWEVLFSKSVAALNDTSFEILDIGVASRKTYQYQLYYGDQLQGSTYTIQCTFDMLMIGNAAHQYYAPLEPSYTMQRNTNMSYIVPFYSRTPIGFKNGEADYCTGTASGYFTSFDAKGNPDFSSIADYRSEVMNFLANNIVPKILKTPDGEAWLVQVDSSFSKDYSGYADYELIKFNWTEIGDISVENSVVVI